MLNQVVEANRLAPPPVRAPCDGGEVQAFRLANAILGEMQERCILPNPFNYDLWFTFRSGTNLALSACLEGLIFQGETFTPDLLCKLHGEFLAGIDEEVINDSAGALHEAANEIVGQVAASCDAMRDYGKALETCSVGLGREATFGSLLQAVGILTAETAKAADRNRTLEQQLSASASRVAKLRQTLIEVKAEATTDALTGITNRKAFEVKLRRAIAGAKNDPDLGTFSVLLLDIDHFKNFNDTYGHKTGDLVLRLVGRVLSDNVKGRDTAARYGGEEFVILLLGADLRAAATVAQQMGAALSSKRLVNRQKGDSMGQITVSVGVAQHRPGDTATVLMERADLALYRAKHTGRNRVCTELDLASISTR